jgi:type VI secretion system Hcp family effector
MPRDFYVTITSTPPIKGDAKRPGKPDAMLGLSFHFGGAIPYDVGNMDVSGRRRYDPITFTRQLGPASPNLFDAFTKKNVLTQVLFEFTRMGQGTGEAKENVYYKITLFDAVIVHIKYYQAQRDSLYGGSTTSHAVEDVLDIEEISLVFKGIEVESKDSKAMASDKTGLKT